MRLLLLTLYLLGLNLFSEDLDPAIKTEIAKLSQEGHSYLRMKNAKQLERVSSAIYSKSKNSPDSYYFKGAAYYIQKKYKSAIPQFEKALSYNPDHDPTLFLMGMSYFKINLFEKAVVYLEKAAESGSFHPYYRYNLSIIHYTVGNYEKAKIEAEKTLRFKENYFKAKVVLIKSLMRLKKSSEAFRLAREMYERKQELDLSLPLYIELLVTEDNNYKDAISLLTKKSSLSSNEKRLLAYSYMQEGELGKASIFYKQLVSSEN
ncbi:MAG: tetratricopeptide repeat protein, partial [Leptospiraceae bacterium]|nr:tetratricopeptide repeat protein [Leptospiraceae bacterium]